MSIALYTNYVYFYCKNEILDNDKIVTFQAIFDLAPKRFTFPRMTFLAIISYVALVFYGFNINYDWKERKGYFR